jgi:serine/threonine protein kinase
MLSTTSSFHTYLNVTVQELDNGAFKFMQNKQVIKVFQFLSRLGGGGVGEVFLVHSTTDTDQNPETLALKRIAGISDHNYSYIIETCNQFRQFTHPAIAKIMDVFYVPSKMSKSLYITMVRKN